VQSDSNSHSATTYISPRLLHECRATKQAAACCTHWSHHCCMGDGQRACLPDQQRICRRRLREMQVRQILGSLLTLDPASSCLDPLCPWRVVLEEISQHPLQVVRGRGFRRGQPLALPPVFTCQITCVTPKLPCRHDEQAEGLIQALLISPGIELWEVTCSQVVFKQDHRACQIPAQMIVTPHHQRRTDRPADSPLSEEIRGCEFTECLHAGRDVMPHRQDLTPVTRRQKA